MLKEWVISKLLSALPTTIQCSNTKKGGYNTEVNKLYAIENYNFIQFDHPKKYQFISIDIDSFDVFNSVDSIYDMCNTNAIPLPSIITMTEKGWHLHWYLQEPIWKNNIKLTLFRRRLVGVLNSIFGGDYNSAGKIFRNPLKHKYYCNPSAYSFSDFSFLVTFDEIEEELSRNSRKRIKVRKINTDFEFNKVKEGNRNNTLFKYMRLFIFKNISISLSVAEQEALRVNNKFQEPLPVSEVKATVKSVYFWVLEHYDNNYKKTKYSNNYNKIIAKYKSEKTYVKALTNVFTALKKDEVSYFTLFTKMISYRKLAKIAKVSDKSIKRYLERLLLDLLLVIKKELDIICDSIISFSSFKKEFNIDFSCNDIDLNKIKVRLC